MENKKNNTNNISHNPTKAIPVRKIIIAALLAMESIYLGYKLFVMVNRFSVNLIYWDQFDFMTPFFTQKSIWAMFTWQHSPHRQGLGELITWVVIQLSHWNTRAEAFTILGVLYLCLPLALLIRYQSTRELSYLDLLLPVIVLNKYQWEQFINTPNISHSVLPLFLILIYALAMYIPRRSVRYGIILLANFFLIFTGFGFFMGIITIGLFAHELIQAVIKKVDSERLPAVVGLGVSILSLGSFFIGYVFSPAVACFSVTPGFVARYPVFIGLMLMTFTGLVKAFPILVSSILGILLLLGFLAALGVGLVRYFRDLFGANPIYKVVVTLIGFSMLYAGFSAVGRVCLGVEAGITSRYMTLLIPCFLGLVIILSTIKTDARRLVFVGFLGLVLVKSVLPFDETSMRGVLDYSKGKNKWKACFLKTEDYQFCNQDTGFMIYPADPDRISKRLRYLQEHHLNLFLDE